MAEVYLQLGSNSGGRRANIMRALTFLENALGKPEAVSEIIETEAVGFKGAEFLNCAARYRTRFGPRRILALCKKIEWEMGRREVPEYASDGSRIYHDRVIDIDILLYCPAATPGRSLVTHSKELTLPHPQVETRSFVRPLLSQVLKRSPRRRAGGEAASSVSRKIKEVEKQGASQGKPAKSKKI